MINMNKKLHISLIFSNLVVFKTLSSSHRMYNLYTKFVKILEICKQFSENLVNESGNIPRRGPVPKFSDLEVVALSLTAEAESIDSEKWLFDYKLQEILLWEGYTKQNQKLVVAGIEILVFQSFFAKKRVTL